MLSKLMRTINDMQRIFITISLISLLLISGCSHQHFPWVYRIDVEQGNVLEKDDVAQIKIGMTKAQIKYVLGTPMTQDTFNQDRWDYFYSYRTGKGIMTRESMSLTFKGDILADIVKKEYEEIKVNN